MDLPSELLLNIAEYQPDVHLQIDPHEIVRRIAVVNPDFDINSYLLQGLELANRQAQVRNTLACRLFTTIKGLNVDKCSIYHYIFQPEILYVRILSPDEINTSILQDLLQPLFGVDYEKQMQGTTRKHQYIFQLSKYEHSTFIQDIVDVAIAYRAMYDNSGDMVVVRFC